MSGVHYSRTTACEGISCVYGLAFPHISHTEKWWSPVSDNDRVCVSLSLCRGDYPMITFWGWLQPATIPSNLTGWLWTACDRMDCFLSPATRMGEKAVCEWRGEVVDVGFKSTSTASTSLAVGELLQLMVQQPSALVVTGMLATIKTEKLWWCWQSQLIKWIKFRLPVTLL